jgi:hypothetical protein
MNKQQAAIFSTDDLGPFLFSGVALEHTGMELTLLSALARRGLDPWREAARLAALPRPVAMAELSKTLDALRIPNGATVARRLVGLLPNTPKAATSRAATPRLAMSGVAGKPNGPSKSLSMGWLMAALVAGSVSGFFLTPKTPPDTVAPASWFSEAAPAKDAGRAKPAPLQEAVKDAPATPSTAHEGNG